MLQLVYCNVFEELINNGPTLHQTFPTHTDGQMDSTHLGWAMHIEYT